MERRTASTFSVLTPQPLPQVPKRMTAVRHAHLPALVHVGQRLTVRRIEEDRVVPEAIDPARFGADLTLDRPHGFEDKVCTANRRERADESRGAGLVRPRGQAPIDLVKPLLVRRIRTEIPCRPDARLAVERIDDEPGVFRDCQERRIVQVTRGRLRVIPGFQPGVLGERRARFLGFVEGRQIAEREEFDGESLEHGADLAQLVAIGRRDEQRRRPRHLARYWPTSPRCSAKSCRVPVSARSSRRLSASRPNGSASAVPCSSMYSPPPVFTTFMSTSARESSAYARSSIGSPSTMPTLVAAT